MSKTHGRGRIDNKGGHNHGYYNRTSAGEEKRPSVFDRLGTRRENSGSHFPPVLDQPAAYKSKSDPLKALTHSQRQGHSSTKRAVEVEPRSRSVSPRMKKKSTQSGLSHRSKKDSALKSVGSRDKDKLSGKKSSPKRLGSSKPKTKNPQTLKSRSNNKSGSRKGSIPKGKGKIRSSSLSSEGSTSRGSSTSSSTHTRTTTSTATEEASSTSSTAQTSTTESSVPSIKLKPAKKEKQKKKMKKKSRLSASVEKARHVDIAMKRQSMSSSGSSRDSRKESHHYKDISRTKSGGNWHKSPSRGSSTYEGKSFSKEGRSLGREKELREFEHLSRAKERQVIEEESRKRHLSNDGYGNIDGNYLGHKRSRTVPSPPPKYSKPGVGRRSRSPSPRRIPPDSPALVHKFMTRRDRTPPTRSASKERERLRIIRSPHRRPSFEEHHRRPESRKDRPHTTTFMLKVAKEIDRERERPFVHNTQHGGPVYPPRDTSRTRDRYAPARTPALDRSRLVPKHLEPERERIPLMGKDRLKEYDNPRVVRPLPLLGSNPLGNKPLMTLKPNQPRLSHDEQSRPRPGIAPGVKKHAPMIVKTKEALLERYEEQTIKQSRVDMWVDQTLQGSTRLNVDTFDTDKLPPKRTVVNARTPTPDEIKDKCSSIGSLSGINETINKVEAKNNDKNLELSDFSDDDDDLLTQDINQSPSVKSSSSVKDNQDLAESVPGDGGVDDSTKTAEDSSSIAVGETDSPTVVSTTSLPPRGSYDLRDARSLQSQSQTDDDILERMDFEEISDEELGEVENKISIVDVLGVNWASLLSKPETSSNQLGASSADCISKKVRQRWTPLHVFQQVGLSRKLCGEELFQKVVDKIRENLKINDEDPKEYENLENELEKPILRRRRLERHSLLENFGLGPHSRALSAKRDMVVRRCLLNLPPKSLISLEFGNQSSGPINTPQEPDFATDLLKISVAHYKNS